MSPGFLHAIRRPPLPPPQVQVRLPWPPYLGPFMPRWCTPLHMVSPYPCEQGPYSLDSSSDSSLEDIQDPHLDSRNTAQSPPVPGAAVPGLSNSLVVSQTTVEVHSISGPSADFSTLSPCPAGPAGAPPPSAPLEEDTDSDSSFASLSRRIRRVHSSFPPSNPVLGSSQACRSSLLASSSIRSFSIHSPRLALLQGSDSSSAGDPVSSRSSRSFRRPSLPIPTVRSRASNRWSWRPRPSLPSRLETLTAHYQKQGCSRLALQIFKQGHTDSTHRAYESAWPLFRGYLSKRIHPSRIRSSDIFNFLAFHRRVHNRQYRTLAKYRAAIKLPIKKHSKIDRLRFLLSLCRV